MFLLVCLAILCIVSAVLYVYYRRRSSTYEAKLTVLKDELEKVAKEHECCYDEVEPEEFVVNKVFQIPTKPPTRSKLVVHEEPSFTFQVSSFHNDMAEMMHSQMMGLLRPDALMRSECVECDECEEECEGLEECDGLEELLDSDAESEEPEEEVKEEVQEVKEEVKEVKEEVKLGLKELRAKVSSLGGPVLKTKKEMLEYLKSHEQRVL